MSDRWRIVLVEHDEKKKIYIYIWEREYSFYDVLFWCRRQLKKWAHRGPYCGTPW